MMSRTFSIREYAKRVPLCLQLVLTSIKIPLKVAGIILWLDIYHFNFKVISSLIISTIEYCSTGMDSILLARTSLEPLIG